MKFVDSIVKTKEAAIENLELERLEAVIEQREKELENQEIMIEEIELKLEHKETAVEESR